MSAPSTGALALDTGAAAATDPAVVRGLLVRCLPPDGGAHITSCRMVRSRVRSGTRAIVQYAVGVADSTRHDELRVTVQWHADPLRAARHRRHARAAADAVTTWTQPLPPTMDDEATGLLATTFPCDLRLTGLASVVHGDAPALVAAMSAWAGVEASRLAGVAVDTVRYREQLSAVCRYTLRLNDGTAVPPFYVKVFADDGGARAAVRLDRLAEATARLAGAARVRPTVAWLPALRALVLPAAPGTPLDVALATTSPAAREILLRRVAAALARFAAATPALDVHRTRDDLTAATTRALDAIARLLPAEAGLDTLGAAIAARLPGGVTGLTHGDLKLEHVLVDDAAVWLIDLDSCHLGDPRWDLALLAARCDGDHLRAGQTAALGGDWRALRDAYVAAGGPAVEARGLGALRAAAWVDVAAGVLKRHEDGAASRATTLLDLARREVTAS